MLRELRICSGQRACKKSIVPAKIALKKHGTVIKS
jgi:hypothetical protein